MTAKNRYMVDNFNRLIIKCKRKSLITQGRFSIDRNNRFKFWLNEPATWRREHKLPAQISFKGNWQLNANYDLELKLAETKDQYATDYLVIKGEIISTDRDSLVFEIKSQDKKGLLHIQLLKLSGFWQADEYNRLCFAVEKKVKPYDILTLQGIWQINQNQQVVYIYEKTDLKRKTKTLNTLNFAGFWQINSANRLTYILARSTKSCFDFRVQIESPNLYPQEGVIKYRLGIGVRQAKTSGVKTLSLYGTWKFKRKLGLIFQMDYGQGKIQSIEFGADVNFSKKDKVIFTLTDKRKEPLGLCLTFSHSFLKDLNAETFLRLKKYKEETGIEAGVRVPF